MKIADLGLARNFEGDELRATQTDAVVGTWEYLAPERALGRTVDARTDLYAFGVVCTNRFGSADEAKGRLDEARGGPLDHPAASFLTSGILA